MAIIIPFLSLQSKSIKIQHSLANSGTCHFGDNDLKWLMIHPGGSATTCAAAWRNSPSVSIELPVQHSSLFWATLSKDHSCQTSNIPMFQWQSDPSLPSQTFKRFTKNYQLSFRFGLAIPRQRFSKKKLIQSGPLILPGPMFVCFAASSYHPTPPEQSSSSTHCSDNLLLVCCRYLALSNPPLGVKFQYKPQLSTMIPVSAKHLQTGVVRPCRLMHKAVVARH